jgi:AcrR family transcriptional regulator
VNERTNARDPILDAAQMVVAQQGAKGLSFDAVAKAANISRGGVLYHFASKELLIQAMIERLIEHFEAALEHEMALDPDAHGRFTRAFARATFRMDAETSAVFSGLIAAIGYDPELIAPLRERWERWQRLSERELGVPTAAIVRMASHALWLNGIFGMNNYSAKDQAKIVSKLEELTREGSWRRPRTPSSTHS